MKKILTIHIWTTIPPSTANTAFFRRMATGRPTKKHLLEQAGKDAKQSKLDSFINKVTGDVVTVQDKAWNDSVCTILYVDVLLGPTKEKLGKLFLVWGSCGPHTVQTVKDVFAEWGIDVAQLPVRMTSLLQIMDLVVNGPVKAAVRDARCQQLVGHLRAFLAARKLEDDKPVAERVYAPFSPPPKPTQT